MTESDMQLVWDSMIPQMANQLATLAVSAKDPNVREEAHSAIIRWLQERDSGRTMDEQMHDRLWQVFFNTARRVYTDNRDFYEELYRT